MVISCQKYRIHTVYIYMVLANPTLNVCAYTTSSKHAHMPPHSTHKHAHAHAHTRACTHAHTHTHKHACMHAWTHGRTHTPMHAHTHARTHTHTYTHTNTHTPTRTYTRTHPGEEVAANAGEKGGQAYVGVNWVMEDKEIDVETELALGFLDYLMLVRVCVSVCVCVCVSV
jgi:hypothetical protein